MRRIAQQRAAIERCQFCKTPVPGVHRHLLEMATRKMVCSCDSCARKFQYLVRDRFKLIPRGARLLPDFALPESLWEDFAMPINLAFFYRETASGKVVALYPSRTGATESPLTSELWERLEMENPELAEMEPDVEALLVNRVGGARECFITPMDACYELAGLMRLHWRGLSGGESMWHEIDRFFASLRERATVSGPESAEMIHA